MPGSFSRTGTDLPETGTVCCLPWPATPAARSFRSLGIPDRRQSEQVGFTFAAFLLIPVVRVGDGRKRSRTTL